MTTPQDMSIGRRIRWARKRAGLSQDALAAAIGTTRQVVIRWEKDRHLPNLESREKLAAATGQPAEFFAEQPATRDEEDEEETELAMRVLQTLRAVVRSEQRRSAPDEAPGTT
jgi:transcriptional regulator with XRE-family HTH domain